MGIKEFIAFFSLLSVFCWVELEVCVCDDNIEYTNVGMVKSQQS